MGASWIAGIRNNPITELAEAAGAELGDTTDYDNIAIYDFDGTADPISASEEEDFYNKTINASRDAYRARSVESMETLFDDLRNDGEFSYLNNREYNYLVNTFYEHEYSGDVSVMSAQSAREGNDLLGGDVILPEGYDQLIDYLAEGMDVRFNTVVNAVSYDETGVVVGSNQGDFMAERVIVTVAVGVLQSGDIQFEPALPASKQRAIDNLAMGTLNKIWMIFSYAFWDTDKDTIGYVSSTKGEYTEWYYFEELSQGNVLLCFNGGEFGESSEDKSKQQLTDEAMAVLKTIYGNDIPDPSDVLVSRWHLTHMPGVLMPI
jgi:monoamine oxidase